MDATVRFLESPLVLSFNAGDTTVEFLGQSVPFNLDGNGAHPVDWVAPTYPLLALDLNEDGVINDGRELFGTATVLKATQQRAADGFSALAQYDDDGDKLINQNDAVFSRLLLWFDRNSDGASQPSELTGLPFKGVTAIHLDAQGAPANSSANAFITFTSTFDEQDCSATAPMFIADVWFRSTP